MNSFYAKDGLFWLNDQPAFIQAGEFHYFRTPVDQWPHRLGLLQKAGFNTVAAYIPWLWHQPQADVSDVDGHTHPMRNLAGFLDLATKMGFCIIARPGPYIMAETINEGIPPWVFEQYPQVAIVDQNGKAQNIVSYLHPDFLACVDKWYEAVFEVLSQHQVTNGGNIIMIQLDNEMAMPHWVRNMIDTNADTLARFAQYLNQTYGDALQKRYPASDLVAFLDKQLFQPEPHYGAFVIDDYRRFFRGYLRDYMDALWQRAKAYGMNTPPVVNIHGFGDGGRTFPIGLSQLVDVMAMDGMISATDVYPIHIDEGNFHQLVMVNEMTKALENPQQALFSIEFQAGGNQDFGGAQSSLYDLHSRLCISCGMRAINHYLFFDGENDPVLSPTKRHNWGHPVRKDGTLRRHYARYPELSQVISAYGDDLVCSRPKTVTTIGFQLDDYMTEVNNNFSRSQTNTLTHQRNVILFDFLARGLALTQRPFAAVELSRSPLDAEQTPTLWVMMEKQCNAATQQKLVDYVTSGGKLVLVGRMCEETFDHQPCTILLDALGIESIHSDEPFSSARIDVLGYNDVPVNYLETYSGEFDEVFATVGDQITGFIKRLGQGRVMMLGAAFPANTLDDLDVLNQMVNRIGCEPLVTLTEWADVRLSEGTNGNFLFVSNYQDDPLETVISLCETPLFGGQTVELPARRGAILPLEWHVRPGIMIHYLTSEVVEITQDNSRLILRTRQLDCFAEVSLTGYHCPMASEHLTGQHIKLHIKDGTLTFTK